MKIAFIGVGHVGGALARNLASLGHEVTIAARDPDSQTVKNTLALVPGLRVAPITAAVVAADVVFLATPFEANETVLRAAGAALDGKALVDCTNPIGDGLTHGLGSRTSGAEFVQSVVPRARVVKAFSIYGYENFEDSRYPGYGGLKPAMLLAGDEPVAKEAVGGLCAELGWQPVDVGPLALSLHLEHLALLWIKMARAGVQGTGFVWAFLQRGAQERRESSPG